MATSAAINALTPEEQAVLVPIQDLFDGIAKRDRDAMKRVVLPEGGATIIRHNQILHFTLEALCKRPFPPDALSLEEKIYDPLVRIDDNIAPPAIFFGLAARDLAVQDGPLTSRGPTVRRLPDTAYVLGHGDEDKNPGLKSQIKPPA
jgi:hypothetical protein